MGIAANSRPPTRAGSRPKQRRRSAAKNATTATTWIKGNSPSNDRLSPKARKSMPVGQKTGHRVHQCVSATQVTFSATHRAAAWYSIESPVSIFCAKRVGARSNRANATEANTGRRAAASASLENLRSRPCRNSACVWIMPAAVRLRWLKLSESPCRAHESFDQPGGGSTSRARPARQSHRPPAMMRATPASMGASGRSPKRSQPPAMATRI